MEWTSHDRSYPQEMIIIAEVTCCHWTKESVVGGVREPIHQLKRKIEPPPPTSL
jgi:hypothetical protein